MFSCLLVYIDALFVMEFYVIDYSIYENAVQMVLHKRRFALNLFPQIASQTALRRETILNTKPSQKLMPLIILSPLGVLPLYYFLV